MKRTRLLLPAIIVVAAVVVAVIASTSSGSTKHAQPAVAATSAISLKQTSLGKVLVDANGRTLYLFGGDKLSAAGRAVWPPFTSNVRPAAENGVNAAQIGTITGSDGAMQITYRGHPLYYYVGDHTPGQTAGQGLNEFGGYWYVLSAGGSAITSASTSATPSTPTAPSTSTSSSTGSYAY